MTTIILVTIGILLAGVAASFMFFYGGDSYDSGSTRARAATLENAGHNVEAAVAGYRAENGMPPETLDNLKGKDDRGRWIASAPVVRNAAAGTGEIASIEDALYYRVASVIDEDTCRRVNRDYGGKDVVLDSIGDAPRGCYRDGADLHYFVRLSGAGTTDGGTPAQPPAPVKARADEPATCSGLQVSTGSAGGGSYGKESGTISAYSLSEANTVCQYLAAINGPGTCTWSSNDIHVGYIRSVTETVWAWSWQTASACEYKASFIPPRPSRNAFSGASCAGPMVAGQVSGGYGGLPVRRVSDTTEAASYCAGLAAQYGEGACRYSPEAQGGSVEYVRGAMAVPSQGFYAQSMQCR